jgi:hypothetical protein
MWLMPIVALQPKGNRVFIALALAGIAGVMGAGFDDGPI